ncbi:MAG: glycosyltransferase family 4 protein [Actinomycetota bacterium]|nr:glycosyltransferase family 4 protein [Actinomycetota bacterium]
MTAARTAYVLVPEGIDDPARPSGGNTYDRRICEGLARIGWSVRERAVPGSWPTPHAAARSALARALAPIPDGAVVLVDGLIASTVPEVLVAEAERVRLVVLLHMPLGVSTARDAHAHEDAALSAAAGVVTTSRWTRDWLLRSYPLRPEAVHVAEPGVDTADLAPGTAAGGELLCVAAVTPGKGHDVLLAALVEVADLSWRCVCVGTLTRDRDFVEHLVRVARDGGIDDRVRFTGPRTGDGLAVSYAAADVLVLATRVESYGMVVTEALARGLPVVASSAGGLPEAVGLLPDGNRPGLLVPPGDPAALAAALRRWLADGELRGRLRAMARERRSGLSGWPETSARISRVLAEVAR